MRGTHWDTLRSHPNRHMGCATPRASQSQKEGSRRQLHVSPCLAGGCSLGWGWQCWLQSGVLVTQIKLIDRDDRRRAPTRDWVVLRTWATLLRPGYTTSSWCAPGPNLRRPARPLPLTLTIVLSDALGRAPRRRTMRPRRSTPRSPRSARSSLDPRTPTPSSIYAP